MKIKGPVSGFILPGLPYGDDALEPMISARTISLHYGGHHAGYVNALNKLTDGTGLSLRSLEKVVLLTAEDAGKVAIFQNAAQVWNHNFYWLSMCPQGGGVPGVRLKGLIEREFGTFAKFGKAFSKAAIGAFGSGWVWLVVDDTGKLEITVTANADTPIVGGKKPLIALDVWEHAYYLDFENRRADYIGAWLTRLVDWRFAERNLG